MPLAWTEWSDRANGGTEQMGRGLEQRLPPGALDDFQVFPSRVERELDPDKWRILWAHDTANDPMYGHLGGEGWRRFHRIVFVSHWQKEQFLRHYPDIPRSMCRVVLNAVDNLPEPSPMHEAQPVRIIYHTTPHRGLNILLGAFDRLSREYKGVHLDLYSSFGLYGQHDRDEKFGSLFRFADDHPQITNHGAVDRGTLGHALVNADIFAYPSTWPETSCRCLMEAMAAGLMCVHPDLGALPETAASWTYMYPYTEHGEQHVQAFYNHLRGAVDFVMSPDYRGNASQASYARLFYSWGYHVQAWENVLGELRHENPSRAIEDGPVFTYRT